MKIHCQCKTHRGLPSPRTLKTKSFSLFFNILCLFILVLYFYTELKWYFSLPLGGTNYIKMKVTRFFLLSECGYYTMSNGVCGYTFLWASTDLDSCYSVVHGPAASAFLGAFEKCGFSGPTPDLLGQNLHFNKIYTKSMCPLKCENH